jgi:hypothetical protein
VSNTAHSELRTRGLEGVYFGRIRSVTMTTLPLVTKEFFLPISNLNETGAIREQNVHSLPVL